MNQVGSTGARLHRALHAIAAATLAAGCLANPPIYSVPPPPGTDTPLDQAGRGADLYAQSCASCHGENGEGSEGHVALIGPKALPIEPVSTASSRKGKLATAQDLFAFVKSDMPPLAPGSLDDDQAWALTAHLIKANGTDLRGKDLGPAEAVRLSIHRP